MSIATRDIFAFEQPKHGIIPASIYAEIKFADSMRVSEILALPDKRADYVRRRIIARVYGDIAQDFESFLDSAFPEGLPPLNPEAADLLETVRKKLAGEGPGRPVPSYAPNHGVPVTLPD